MKKHVQYETSLPWPYDEGNHTNALYPRVWDLGLACIWPERIHNKVIHVKPVNTNGWRLIVGHGEEWVCGEQSIQTSDYNIYNVSVVNFSLSPSVEDFFITVYWMHRYGLWAASEGIAPVSGCQWFLLPSREALLSDL